MSYILCKTKTAKKPFFIENISTNIYSMEELCYYLYNNLYLIDDTLLNEKLCVWLKDELGLQGLSKKLTALMEQKVSVGEMILPVFKEIYYLSHEQMRIFLAKLSQYEAQPERVRLKMKGDYLFGNEKFRNALNVYKKSLQIPSMDETGSQFEGSVYYNMGCAHARLFEVSEARECLKTAYDMLHSHKVLTGYLTAVYLADGEEALHKAAGELGVDAKTVQEVLLQIQESENSAMESESALRYKELKDRMENGDRKGYEEGMRTYLKDLTDTYHKNTGY